MSKMHYFSNEFSKIVKRWGLFDIGHMKCNMTNLWFFKIIMTKSNIKNQL